MTLLLNIDVPDVETGVRFYTAAFALEVGRRFGTDFVELLGWPATVYLLAKAAGTVGAGGDLRRYGRHWTPVHADIVVDDVDAAVARAVGAGAKLEAPVETVVTFLLTCSAAAEATFACAAVSSALDDICSLTAVNSLEAPAKDTAYGRIAMLADPFGHGFCLLQFNGQGYDALLAG